MRSQETKEQGTFCKSVTQPGDGFEHVANDLWYKPVFVRQSTVGLGPIYSRTDLHTVLKELDIKGYGLATPSAQNALGTSTQVPMAEFITTTSALEINPDFHVTKWLRIIDRSDRPWRASLNLNFIEATLLEVLPDPWFCGYYEDEDLQSPKHRGWAYLGGLVVNGKSSRTYDNAVRKTILEQAVLLEPLDVQDGFARAMSAYAKRKKKKIKKVVTLPYAYTV